jgi:amino acid permease
MEKTEKKLTEKTITILSVLAIIFYIGSALTIYFGLSNFVNEGGLVEKNPNYMILLIYLSSGFSMGTFGFVLDTLNRIDINTRK